MDLRCEIHEGLSGVFAPRFPQLVLRSPCFCVLPRIYNWLLTLNWPYFQLVEDTVAVTGVGIAGACLGLTWYCNNPMYDALGMMCPLVRITFHWTRRPLF